MIEKKLEDCTKEQLIDIVKGMIFMTQPFPQPGEYVSVGIPDIVFLLNSAHCEVTVQEPHNQLCKVLVLHRECHEQ